VFKTIGSLFVLTGLLLNLSAQAGPGGGGGMDSGGGSGLALIFRSEGFRAAKIISTIPNFPLSTPEFEQLVRSTRVEVSVDQLLDADGKEVSAIANRKSKLLCLNGEKVFSILFAKSLSLTFVVHQYLLIAGIDDKDYKVSGLLLASKDQVLTNISCTSKVRQEQLVVSYKASDSDGDGRVDAESTFAYTDVEDQVNMRIQHDLPLSSQYKSGVLLTISNVGMYVMKLLLPKSFLEQKNGETELSAYFVNIGPEETRIARNFSCKHVNDETQLSDDMPPAAARKPATTKKDDGFRKEFNKAMTKEIAANFQKQIRYAAKVVPQIEGFPLSFEQFQKLIDTTRMEFTDEELYEPGGMRVDALNFPKIKLIRFNIQRAIGVMMAPRQSLQLLVHEFLGIAGIDDSDYSVSQKVLDLRGELVRKWTCESESIVEKDKMILSSQEIDYNGDGVADEVILAAFNSKKEAQQVPFSIVDTDLDINGIKGLQIVWAPLKAIHSYQVYLPKNILEHSLQMRLPYYMVSESPEDDFTKPAGFMNCSMSIR
jgi:hypothetical protein